MILRFLPFLALAAAPVLAQEPVRFNRDIRPILSENCFSCHGPDKASRKAGLRLDERAAAVAQGAIVPGKPNESELLARVLSDDPHQTMPPPKLKKILTPTQKNLLRRWIAEGATYERHWAFLPIPKQTAVPNVNGWGRNAIDAFVLDRLRREKLEPAEEAPRDVWLRRVTFDLTGLPPTLEELDAFLADASPQAHETVVDRLLKSPAYAERMANDWLDVARYADTFGYQADRLMHMWPWRDWVLQAFQKNLSYDKFLLWQTAGDLLPEATREQKLATAFNRLHRQTNEGGSIEEEFRVEIVADRLRTNGMAFLGLTFECARCHDHKFDPISTKDYYRLSAFFNNIDEHGLYSHFTETAPTPNLLLYQGDQEAQHHALLGKIRATEKELRDYRAERLVLLSVFKIEDASPTPAATFSFEGAMPTGDVKLVPGKVGSGLAFGGDDAFPLAGAGEFDRTTPFSMGLWLKPAQHLPRMVVLHRSRAAEDSAFRGYSLVLDDGHAVVSLVHFWPGNALQVRSRAKIPVKAWSHVAFTYDGSSKASGLALYIDGKRADAEVVRDRLTRDIVHRAEWGDADAKNIKLALGARFRDVGFRQGAVDELNIFARELSALEIALVAGAKVDGLKQLLHAVHHDKRILELRGMLQTLRTEENQLVGKVKQVMVMQEMPTRRATHVLYRGAYDAPREAVEPGTPAEIFPFSADYPGDRLGFARWLLDDQNPLTARVAVNRVWQMYFHRGLAATAEDFGSQGSPPSHPELLDWLARRFIDSGWDLHDLHRTIALSATYRQSSAKPLPRDPENALLARGPRGRHSAEMIRDNALAISGLLVRKVGGPSVYPYQPAGIWEESGTHQSYPQGKGESLYRRSLYTFWRRTSPPPSMTTFDAPSRELCLARRERTATPLQSLVLLNDPQYVEAARVLAEKLCAEPDLASRIAKAFRLATSRTPNSKELAVLTRLYAEQKARFDARPKEAEAFLKVGDWPRDRKLVASEHAALTVVVQALMNLDECVSKR